MPWKMQEKVSSREADSLGVMPYSWLISLAMGPAMTMATVLLAVAMSMAPTSRPTPRRPPTLPRNTRRMKASRASKPPWARIRAHMADTRMVTMMVSNMPEAPLPMPASMVMKSMVPVPRVMMMPATMPTSSTRNTFCPASPPMRTST